MRSVAPVSVPLPSVELLASLRYSLRNASRVSVLTGAGVSTESGIPDYRSPGRPPYNPIRIKDFIESFYARRRYWARSFLGRMRIAQVQPNHTHLRVAQWEAKQERWFAGLITQNVDGLHFAAGGHKVIELHGSLSSTSCIECKAKESRDAFQNRLAESNSDFKALGEHLQKELLMRPDGDMNLLNQSGLDIDRFRIPRCLACGARESIRPDVVFFGENVDRDLVDKCYALVDQSDLLLVLGSSLQVFSAYRFVKFAHEKNKKICIVNVGPTRADALAHLKIEGYCSYVLQHVDPFDSTT